MDKDFEKKLNVGQYKSKDGLYYLTYEAMVEANAKYDELMSGGGG